MDEMPWQPAAQLKVLRSLLRAACHTVSPNGLSAVCPTCEAEAGAMCSNAHCTRPVQCAPHESRIHAIALRALADVAERP